MQRRSHNKAWLTSAARQVSGGPLVPLTIRLNGVERAIPLLAARTDAAAALCRGAQLARDRGGFEAEVRDVPVLVARVPLPHAAPLARVQRRVEALAGDLLQIGMDAAAEACVPIGYIPGLYLCGGLGGDLEAHVHGEKPHARGREVLRTVAESLARPLARLAECAEAAPPVTLGELQHQRVEARCRIAASELLEERGAARPHDPERAAPRADLRRELELDHHDPPLAAAHNSRVIEAMLGASAALGLDHRLWEGEARRYAGRWGSCEPLVRWRCVRGELIGELRLPLVLDHERAGAAPPSGARRKLADVKDAMMQLACVALAASLAFSSARWRARASRPRSASALPPPLPAPVSGRERLPGKRSSDSGVRAAVPREGRARAG